jgi:hypothetical protein
MSRRFEDLFEDKDKAYITFNYRNHGKSVTLDNEYPYDVTWDEIVNDLISCLEGEFGYSFRLTEEHGIYYPGKGNDD